jgi:hypothetical protein
MTLMDQRLDLLKKVVEASASLIAEYCKWEGLVLESRSRTVWWNLTRIIHEDLVFAHNRPPERGSRSGGFRRGAPAPCPSTLLGTVRLV